MSSTCIDVVTPFDFTSPASLPAHAEKFATIPAERQHRGRVARTLFKSAPPTRAASTWVDRLPERVTYKHPSAASSMVRAFYNEDDDGEPAAPAAPRAVGNNAGAVTVTAEFVYSNSKHAAGKPTQIKIIDWKSLSVASSASSSLSSSSSTTALCDSDSETVDSERVGVLGTTDNVLKRPRLSAGKHKRASKVNDDDDEVDDEDGDEAEENIAPVRERSTSRNAYNDDNADPLAGLLEAACAGVAAYEYDLACIIDQMEEF